MLANAPVYASLPTTDLARSRGFYEHTLGLKVEPEEEEGALTFRAGGGTLLLVYQRPPSRAEHTVAFFVVEDFDRAFSGLRERGVVFEDYDMPELKTENGVATSPDGKRVAWFKDPDGNILGLFEK
jgi:catechol 2,3-dioxygenase-like lactoylglutathione lyase family enzyme